MTPFRASPGFTETWQHFDFAVDDVQGEATRRLAPRLVLPGRIDLAAAAAVVPLDDADAARLQELRCESLGRGAAVHGAAG